MAANLLDAVGKLLGVTDLAGHVGRERLLDFLGPHAVEVRAVGEVVEHRLELHLVALEKQGNRLLGGDGHGRLRVAGVTGQHNR